jgi:hypothetical protein
MKNLFAFAIIAGVLTFTACGKKKETTETTVDSTTVTTVDTSVNVAPVDTAAKIDTAAPAAEAPKMEEKK